MHFNVILLSLALSLVSTAADPIGRRFDPDHTLALAPEQTLQERELISSRHDFPTQTQGPEEALEARHLLSSSHDFPPRNTLEARHTLGARHPPDPRPTPGPGHHTLEA